MTSYSGLIRMFLGAVACAGGAASALVAVPPPTPVGIVDLHLAGQLPGGLALQHRLHNLCFISRAL